MKIRTYSELMFFRTFEERFDYLCLRNTIGIATFGFDRYINQDFYNSSVWRSLRNEIIVRDGALDLAVKGRDIFDSIRIHHMNPMTLEDVENGNPDILNPEFLICTSINTHNALHFGSSKSLIRLPIERRRNDTCPWRI
jgi:hypothetical protein